MDQQEKDRLLGAIAILSKSPEVGYKFADCPPGIIGVSEWSLYLTELTVKIFKNGSEEQKSKLENLNKAYKQIVEDLNEAYLLFLMYDKMKKKWKDSLNENEILRRENVELKKEIDKLLKTLNFNEGS